LSLRCQGGGIGKGKKESSSFGKRGRSRRENAGQEKVGISGGPLVWRKGEGGNVITRESEFVQVQANSHSKQGDTKIIPAMKKKNMQSCAAWPKKRGAAEQAFMSRGSRKLLLPTSELSLGRGDSHHMQGSGGSRRRHREKTATDTHPGREIDVGDDAGGGLRKKKKQKKNGRRKRDAKHASSPGGEICA